MMRGGGWEGSLAFRAAAGGVGVLRGSSCNVPVLISHLPPPLLPPPQSSKPGPLGQPEAPGDGVLCHEGDGAQHKLYG